MNELVVKLDVAVEEKVTADQIENGCPERLRKIGEEVRVRLAKMDKDVAVFKRVLHHGVAVEQLLAEAKSLCDEAGFNKFRELFCPQLGKSQAYAWLAVATGKKTLAEHRTEERERKQRTRANQRVAANSGTVPENSEAAPEPHEAMGVGVVEAPGIAPEQSPVPRSTVTRKGETRPRGAAATDRDARRVEGLDRLKACIAEIMKIVSASFYDDRDRLMIRRTHEPYLDALIDEKGKPRFDPSQFEQPARGSPQGNDIESAGESAEARKAKNAALEEDDREAA